MMRTSVRRALCATAMAGGFTVLGIAYATSTASAADSPGTTSGDSGLVSGNQTGIQVAAPVRVAGNQVTVGGDGNSSTHSSPSGGGGGSAGGADSAGQSTSGSDGTASGNQTDAVVDAPVDAADNQVTVLGDDNENTSSGSGGSAARPSRSGGATTSGDDGTGSGNQTGADATAPVDASGNQVTVLGDDNTAQARRPDGAAPTPTSGQGETDGADGTASGNQTVLGLAAPVDVTGNQVTILGDDNASETAGPADAGSDTSGGSEGNTTSGEAGTGSGNQTTPAVTAPIDASGNQVTVLGDDNTSTGGGTDGTDPTDPGTDPGDTTGGTAGDDAAGVVLSPAGDGPGTGVRAAQGGAAFTTGALPKTVLPQTVLPQTGASAMLLLLLLLGLAALFGGLYLVRNDRTATRGRKEVSRSSNHC